MDFRYSIELETQNSPGQVVVTTREIDSSTPALFRKAFSDYEILELKGDLIQEYIIGDRSIKGVRTGVLLNGNGNLSGIVSLSAKMRRGRDEFSIRLENDKLKQVYAGPYGNMKTFEYSPVLCEVRTDSEKGIEEILGRIERTLNRDETILEKPEKPTVELDLR